MSLQPEAVAYHTNPDGTSDFFFGGGSGGGGVTALLGDYPGSVATTSAVPNILGVGSITCFTTTTGLSVIQKPIQSYTGPTAEQTLTNGAGDIQFTIPTLTTVLGGTYVVSAKVSFGSATAVPSGCLVSMSISNASGGGDLQAVESIYPAGLVDYASLSPVSAGTCFGGVVTNMKAEGLKVFIHPIVPPPVGFPLTVFVTDFLLQRVG